MTHDGPQPPPVGLSGPWRAIVSEGDLAKVFFERDHDDAHWDELSVPGHWRSSDAFTDSDGPLLARRRFDGPARVGDERWWLEIDGCFYYGDFWMDGVYLGATEGYFVRHAFEVTSVLAAAGEHVLAAEIACPPQSDRTAKRIVTGVFSHWDCLDPTWNPGGLWRPLRLRATGPLRINRARITCVEASEARGRLAVDLTIDACELDEGAEVVLTIEVRGPTGAELAGHRESVAVATGENRRHVEIVVDDPPRWWPHRLGDQPRCVVDVSLVCDGLESDHVSRLTAFRDVRMRDWIVSVNGERCFLMGSNYAPTRMELGDAEAREMRRDIELARDANLDFLRVHAHVARPELYDAADEHGVMLWQDFPLQWGYARGVRRQAVRQAAIMVDELAHHPSIYLWCAHNEPLAVDLEPGAPIEVSQGLRLASSMALPSWNKDVLDRSVARTIRRADPTRPVVRHSGILPGAAEAGTDSHLYFGWYWGEAAGMADLLRRWPRLARFVSEFGAQAIPDSDEFIEADRWPELDWDRLAVVHGLQRDNLERYVPSDSRSFAQWRDASQAYQAALVQLQIEDLRRLKYRPTGGFAHFLLADAHPAISWSVLDHERAPKLGYEALRDACRSVLGMLDPRTGAVHVASESRDRLADAVITVTVDGVARRFGGDISADGITYVGAVRPPSETAEVIVEHPGLGSVHNTYTPELIALVARVGTETDPGAADSGAKTDRS